MLLPLILSFAIVLAVAVAAGVIAMRRADQHARRTLYASLGYGDEVIGALMGQKGPISAHLALVRKASIMTGPWPDDPSLSQSRTAVQRRSFRYTHALNGTRVARGRTRAEVDRSQGAGRSELS